MTVEISQNRIIHVTIITFDGPEDRFKFKLDTLVKDAKAKALEHFNIEPAPGDVYRLAEKKNDKFRPLNDNNSLGVEGVQNKDEIWLGTEQEVGCQ